MVTKIASRKLHGRLKFQGLDISVENRKGSVRYWHDPHGKETGSTKMHWDYGYIRGTHGTDGDHVDVYVGPNPDAPVAYIIDQMKKPPGEIKRDGAEWRQFDEQKIFLGFDSAGDAQSAYMKQYNDPRFFGGLKGMPMTEFKAKVLSPAYHGEKIAVSAKWMGRRILGGLKTRGIELDSDAHKRLADAVLGYTSNKTPQSAAQARGVIKSLGNKVVAAPNPDTLAWDQDKFRQMLRRGSSSTSNGEYPKHRTGKPLAQSVGSVVDRAVDGLAGVGMGTALIGTAVGRLTTASRFTGAKDYARTGKEKHRPTAASLLGYPVTTLAGAATGAGLGHLLGGLSRSRNTTRGGLIGAGVVGGSAALGALATEREIRGNIRRGDAKAQLKVSSTADRVDDAGIGLLAAPYAASAIGGAMAKHGPARVRAAGAALKRVAGTGSHFDHSNARELTGLALVAPGISHRVAGGIDKLRGEKRAALEELARGVYPDFDCLTAEEQAEKCAGLLGLAGKAVSGAAGFAKGLTGMTKTKALALGGIGAAGVGVGAAYKATNALGRKAEEAGTGSLSPAPAQGLTRAF